MKGPWDDWAKKYGASVKATTPNPNIKKIEIASLARHIEPGSSVIEVGCGNGINLFALHDMVPRLKLAGCDNSVVMLDEAQKEADRRGVEIELAKVDLAHHIGTTYPMMPQFDYVICDRVLINIKSKLRRKRAIERMDWLLKPGGKLLMIENFTHTYANQNRLRRIVGLKNRKWPPFNKFLDPLEIYDVIVGKMKYQFHSSENISSLHDLLLYVVLPKVNPKRDHHGKWDYENPIMNVLTDLIVKENMVIDSNCGQNTLRIWVKPSKL